MEAEVWVTTKRRQKHMVDSWRLLCSSILGSISQPLIRKLVITKKELHWSLEILLTTSEVCFAACLSQDAAILLNAPCLLLDKEFS